MTMFSLFKKKKEVEFPLSFKIDIDSQENTYVSIEIDNEKISPDSFAKALYCINSGLLCSSFLGALIKLKEVDKFYVLKVMDKWDEYIAITNPKTDQNNDPIIKPTQAFIKNAK